MLILAPSLARRESGRLHRVRVGDERDRRPVTGHVRTERQYNSFVGKLEADLDIMATQLGMRR